MPVRFPDRVADLVEVQHVHLQRQHAPAHRRDLVGERRAACLVAQPERDVRAGVGAGERTGAPEPARRRRHQHDLAVEVEPRKILSHLPLP